MRTSQNSVNAKFAHNLHKRANARYKEGTARGFLSPLRKASDRIFGWHPSKDAKLHQGEVRRIPLLSTRVNSALEELEDRLLDRGVPFDSYVGYALETLASAISP